MIRVLQVFAEPLSFGGQESAMMNFYRAINKENYQFDFFTPYYADNEAMISEINELGGKVYSCNKPFESKQRKKYFIEELKQFLKENSYEIVHINSGSTFALAHGAKIAKELGVKKVIVHSHVAGVENLKHKIVTKLYENYFVKYPDYCIGCSELALKWKFSNKVINTGKTRVIYNGINTNNYRFDKQFRDQKRLELGLDDSFVLGSVGRLSMQKNPLFIINVFNELIKIKANAKLMMIGDGELEDEVQTEISKYHLEDKVIRFKRRNDVNKLLSIMDAFVLPSLYEGFPMVLIEAQTAGLKCVCSDSITKESKASDNLVFISLEDSPKKWATELLNVKENNREKAPEIVKEYGFDIVTCSRELEDLYDTDIWRDK